VNDRPRMFGTLFVGILLGGALGYLCLTEDGRRLLARAEPWLDDLTDQLRKLEGAATKARTAVVEGRHSFDTVMRLTGHGQESPDQVTH